MAKPVPNFWGPRFEAFERLWAQQLREYEAKSQPITVTLPNGSTKPGFSWKTTPLEIAQSISKGLAERSIVAKVNGELWDLGRPLEGDASVELLDFENEEARKVFWHSSSHVMGYAMEKVLGCKLSVGPPLETGGFFYEADTDGRAVSEKDYPELEAAMKELTAKKQPYQRLVVKKEDAVAMFEYNPYKADILRSKVPEGGSCTVYRCGELIDPCRGPHIVSTDRVKAVKVQKNSSSYWQGKADQAVLQRLYGIAFPSEKLLKEHLEFLARVEQADHRNVGKQQKLWMFHELSPGCAFFFPHGARIYNRLTDMMKREYRVRGFDEVMTPNMFNCKLWKQSGHWDHYAENMFSVEIEKEQHALKPMNCPGHCLMFGSTSRSYRDLPIRFADFGVLHRNELSGALSGLTRVRRFQQDDAHIFCRRDQIEDETNKALEFIEHIYRLFGFQFYLGLSTRNPAKSLGTEETWKHAESRLQQSLNQFCNIPSFEDPDAPGTTIVYDGSEGAKQKAIKAVAAGRFPQPKQYWKINPNEAAFYGPKIDIEVEDCMRRKFQCATLQLDFVLPERFQLSYVMSEQEKAAREAAGEPGADGIAANARPVMIHRAILGSVERMMAVLTEHWAGKWPMWVSPRQVIVVPISPAQYDYAVEVRDIFHKAGFYSDVDITDKTIKKRIAEAQTAQYNFILVVGAEEAEKRTVNVRTRDNQQHGQKSIEECVAWLLDVVANPLNSPNL
eukprot:TRINITY_DN55968_c0_g1_i1.p1 TRINITY_DN55968_c0_g1~~TRINITY_DN55968_c0_g1_i1.p1  ORF type:complete len:744 (-),score=158.58 TRINITY_DN55968_c0_g1_i1:48-2240(-)